MIGFGHVLDGNDRPGVPSRSGSSFRKLSRRGLAAETGDDSGKAGQLIGCVRRAEHLGKDCSQRRGLIFAGYQGCERAVEQLAPGRRTDQRHRCGKALGTAGTDWQPGPPQCGTEPRGHLSQITRAAAVTCLRQVVAAGAC
jgi:hypothetical protein